MTSWPSTRETPALIAVSGLATVMAGTAWLAPSLLPGLIGALFAVGLIGLAWRHLTAAWVGWLLVTGLSLEMAAADLIGPDAFEPTIAAVKATEIGLVVLTILRAGVVADRFNPIWAFAAMAATGAVVGTHSDLTLQQAARSLVGDVTPFLLFFCVKPPGWGAAMRRAITLAPALSVVLGMLLDIAGLRSVFLESGGLRLAGLGHPAFLAGVCLPALYAGLIGWLRTAAPAESGLIGINLTILFLTGARAPAAYAAIVVGGSLLLAPGSAVSRAHRLVLVAAGLTAIPVLLIVGQNYHSLRLFEVLNGNAADLSGRQLLWPMFEAAAAKAPWFGWGLGSGNLVIPQTSPIVELLHTSAAHNEYLRFQVEGGYVGRTLFIVLFVLWAITHTRRLPALEQVVVRLVFLAFAAHAMTDNVLISTPACVFFAFIAAIYAEADEAASNRLRKTSDVA
jgi:O-antigen ligase